MTRSPRTPDGSPPLDEPLNPTTPHESPPAADHAPADGPGLPPPAAEAPGLGEQIGATKESAQRLVGAHVELAKAEFADIADAAKRAAGLVAIALAAGLVAGLLVVVGLPLFLGEAIFGSMGWGILHGVLLLFAVAIAMAIVALRPGVRAPVGGPFLLALLVGIVVGVLLGLNLTNRAWAAVGDAILPGVDGGIRPLVSGVAGLAIIGAILGLLGSALSGARGGAIVGGLVGGAIAGVLVGWLTAFAPGPRVGAAIGFAVGLIVWMALMGVGVARGGLDSDALKQRFWPDRTIAVTKETIEWARARMPLTRRS
ncbi:MAG TPA: hypothetical protein VFK35_04275 [Candidatus Limnocylindrales bacterium]|nr:hypothetical protein [Candidatus Limnocylindrales bacterium]